MKKITALLLALVTLFCLAGCGSSAKAQSAPVPAPAAREDFAYSNSFASYDLAEPEMPMEAAAQATGGLASEGSGPSVSGAPSAGDIAVDKIIYSASATVETTDFDGTVEKLEALIAQYGGFVESSSVSGNNYYHTSHGYASSRSADYRIRIPSRDFGTVMNALPTLGNVPYSNTYSENITSQYYDVQARLDACRTQEQTLLDMMAKAEKVSDMLEIQEQLSDVRYRIESLQSTLTNWDRQVSYSTITLSVQEVQEYTPESKTPFGEQLRLALVRGFKGVGEFFREMLLWLLEALPALVLLAAFVVLVVLLVRRIRRRAKARRAQSAADGDGKK